MKILVLNSGSSSQKSALFDFDAPPRTPSAPLWEAKIEWDDHQTILTVRTSHDKTLGEQGAIADRPAAVARMLKTLWDGPTRVLDSPRQVNVAGHRVVHGGNKLSAPTLILSLIHI